MVVDLFNTGVIGGAANAARRLHISLRELDIESRFWHLRSSNLVGKDDSFKVMRWVAEKNCLRHTANALKASLRKPFLKKQLKSALGRKPAGTELFSSPQLAHQTVCNPFDLKSDVFHLHWIANFLDYRSFFQGLPDSFPIVWTLHDENPFTGGCHYTGGCRTFTSGCHCCPQLAKRSEQDLAYQYFQIKRHAFSKKNLHIVTPSHWLEGEARNSELLRQANSFQTIHNGLDLETFRPLDKTWAKQQLNMDPKLPVVCFGAESLQNRRKGFRELLETLRIVHRNTSFQGLVFGNDSDMSRDAALPPMKSMGYLRDEARQAIVYSAADVFVLPSLEDNLPQTGVESIACGTPVVAFKVGGIPDYVKPHKTGLLAERNRVPDLARQLEWILNHPRERHRMGNAARLLAEVEFDQTTQALKYAKLYQNLTANFQSSPNNALPVVSV
jgi:glycosyltransferase involved in cell wall biosynthesis